MANTKVFILCAGEGKRLRPYTEDKPKCMVSYQGKALLEYQLEAFEKFNLNDITLIGGYHHEALPKNLYPTVVNETYTTTNMLYSLFCAKDHMDEGYDMIISYGDIIYHHSVLKKLLDATYPCNIVTDVAWNRYWDLRMEDPLKDAETFRWDTQTRRITELGKKPKTLDDIQGQYIGLFKISAGFVGQFKKLYAQFRDAQVNYEKAYMTDFLQFAINKDFPTFGVPIQNQWAEFDTVQDLSLKQEWV